MNQLKTGKAATADQCFQKCAKASGCVEFIQNSVDNSCWLLKSACKQGGLVNAKNYVMTSKQTCTPKTLDEIALENEKRIAILKQQAQI